MVSSRAAKLFGAGPMSIKVPCFEAILAEEKAVVMLDGTPETMWSRRGSRFEVLLVTKGHKARLRNVLAMVFWSLSSIPRCGFDEVGIRA